MQELTFAPDRRSVQATFYHFSDRPSGLSDKRGFSHHDSLIWAIDKIYQTKFSNLPPSYRKVLVDILTSEVPLDHRNLTLLAIANYIVYNLRLTKTTLNPQIFEEYFRNLAPFLISDVSGKTPTDIQEIRANFKTTLFRYVIYVRDNTTDFSISS